VKTAEEACARRADSGGGGKRTCSGAAPTKGDNIMDGVGENFRTQEKTRRRRNGGKLQKSYKTRIPEVGERVEGSEEQGRGKEIWVVESEQGDAGANRERVGRRTLQKVEWVGTADPVKIPA